MKKLIELFYEKKKDNILAESTLCIFTLCIFIVFNSLGPLLVS